MKDLYLYEIILKNQLVSGILVTIEPHEEILSRVQEHELTSSKNLNYFLDEFSTTDTQKSPIIIAVPNLNKIFNSYLKSNTNKIIIDEHESAWQIEDINHPNIINFLRNQKSLYLIDGHHRFDILQKLAKPITAWIVDLNSLTINSFIKVYQEQDANHIIKKLQDNYNMLKKNNLNLDPTIKQINVFEDGECYQIQINQNQSFLEQVFEINDLVESNNVIFNRSIEYENYNMAQLSQEYKDGFFLFTHSALNKDEFQHAKLLPVNSTCFKPKPNKNSLVILNNNLKNNNKDS